MPFSPEHFIQPATDPQEWSRQNSAAIIGAGKAAGEGFKQREANRQFNSEQARLVDNEMADRAQFEQTFGLQERRQGLDEQQFGHEQAKFRFEQEKLAQAREEEGMKLIIAAYNSAETDEEFAKARELYANEYGIDTFALDAQLDGEMEGQSEGQISDPWGPGSSEPAREKREQKMIDELPSGDGVSQAGRIASSVITDGANAVAAKGGVPLGLGQAGSPPIAKARPTKTAPPAKADEIALRLRDQRPVIEIDSKNRMETDQQIAASMQKRMQQLQGMGLTPEQLAYAGNIAAQVHGLPPMPIPPPPAPNPDQPAEAQTEGTDVTLPAAVVEAASMPPELAPSMIREGRTSGGFSFVSRRTGKRLGTLDWNARNDALVAKRAADMQPIVDMAQNDRDAGMLQAAVDAYARTGNEKAFNTLNSYMTNIYSQESRANTSDRQMGVEGRQSVTITTAEQRSIQQKLFERQGLDKMTEDLQLASRALKVLEGDPNAQQQKAILGDVLAAIATRRATDQDAKRFLRDTFWSEMEESINYIVGGGDLAGGRLENIKGLMAEVQRAEMEKRYVMAQVLYNQVLDSDVIQQLAPERSKTIAEQAVREAFPDLNQKRIVHEREPSIRARAATRARSAGVSTRGPDATETTKDTLKSIKPSDFE